MPELPHWLAEPIKKFLQNHVVLSGVLINHLSEVLLAIFLYARLRTRLYFIQITGSLIYTFFTRRKYIIVWNDHDDIVSRNIVEELKKRFKPDGIKFNYRVINSPEKILYYPAKATQVGAIILIISDVTKLSEVEKYRLRIQDKLINYVNSGGTIFGTHDIIYKRTRNYKLQNLFGYSLKNFDRCNSPIQVEINPIHKDHPLVKNVPSSFFLDDGEMCWGDLENGVEVLVTTAKNIQKAHKKIPMLCIRKIPNDNKMGLAIWLSSSDKGDTMAKSLSPPTKEIIQILYNAISLKHEIGEY